MFFRLLSECSLNKSMNALTLLLVVLLVGTALSNPDKEREELLERELLKRLLEYTDKIDDAKRGTDDDEYIEVCTQNPIEIGIVLDTSSSIKRRDFPKGLKFLQEFLQTFDIGEEKNQVRVSLITFAKGIYTDDAFDLDTYHTKDAVINAVGKIRHREGLYTATWDGINYMAEHQLNKAVTRPQAERIAIILTDGNSQEPDRTKAAAEAARADGILTFAIGVGRRVTNWELKNIAGDQDRIYKVTGYDHLDDIKKDLSRQTCVKHKKPKVECGEANPADIYFVFSPMDLGRQGMMLTSSVVQETVTNEELEKGFKFGVVSGSCPDDEGFDLNAYSNADDISRRMNGYIQGHMSKLVERLSKSGYENAAGGRPKARDIAVLIVGNGKADRDNLHNDVAELTQKGVEVYVYNMGRALPSIAGAKILEGGSAKEISGSLVANLCPE